MPSVTLGLGLAATFAWLIPQHAVLPLVAFACAASGRLLQRVEIPFVWFAGTALPLLIAWVLFGQLLPGWQFPWLVWLGLTISCKVLQEIVRLFEIVLMGGFCVGDDAVTFADRRRSPIANWTSVFSLA